MFTHSAGQPVCQSGAAAVTSVTTANIYRGAIPFVIIQVFALLIVAAFPELVTWLPDRIYGR